MKLSKLDQFLEVVEYTRGGDVLSITYDSNAFTATFFRDLSAGMKARFLDAQRADKKSAKARKKATGIDVTVIDFEDTASALEIERDLYAEMLSKYIIKGWSATDDDENPLPPTYENLRRLSPRALRELFVWLRNYKRPLEQEIVTTSAKPTISETSALGSGQEENTEENLIG